MARNPKTIFPIFLTEAMDSTMRPVFRARQASHKIVQGVLMIYLSSWGRTPALPAPAVALALFFAAATFVTGPAAASPAGERFVQGIADKIVTTIKGGGSESQKTREFASVFTGNADIRAIGAFALGQYSQKMSGSQKSEYFRLIRPYVSRAFLRRMTDAAVDKVLIGSSRVRGKNEELVKSRVKFTDGRPDLAISWRLRRKGGRYKVIDILVSGVSMIRSQRDEFTSVIRRNNGNVDALLNYMRGKG